ncbi:MAG: putative sulfate/molybdate transporter [candidate division KSB1 bacterium]|nr:putative sulfate/molybdate transporter [candidate division KSB1 bacterium]MDZ7364610.1 putative sulfate/molybdate transporter [candidate division KSB1 bacterium]MDZ7402642.1 putative sulfate/molybdate transporter [candidate division KSB1 bacterium]
MTNFKPTATIVSAKPAGPGIRFDRNELAGAFGDIGTDLPLLVGISLAAKLDGTSVLVMFGIMSILTALRYRLPMPVQPLKAMAAIVIAQKIDGAILYGAGLAIGVLMLLLSVTGLIDWLARVVPKSVVRGIQFGLGLQLAGLALKEYVQADGATGYILAAASFAITVAFIGNRKYPAALFVIAWGLIYALAFKLDMADLAQRAGFGLPQVRVPQWPEIVTGLVVLALPQIPLSLGNSILATRQVAADLFPDRPLQVRQISLTYSLMNLINPFFGGVPTCHGSGGMAGHYAFGGRTGGSVIIYGAMFLVMGLFFGEDFDAIVAVFPLPVLGVLLLFEGLTMILLVRDIAEQRTEFPITILVGLIAGSFPYGYVIAMVIGTALVYLGRLRFTSLGK